MADNPLLRFVEEQRAERDAATAQANNAPPPKPGGLTFGEVAEDVLLSPLRGGEQFVRGAAGLVNIVPGVNVDTAGSLFGRPSTVAGSVLDGVFQFGAGFVPAVGLVGKLGKLGGLLESGIARNAAAGAAAQFVGFGAHEGRLSDLIQAAPVLRNPVSAFLASRPDDGEAEGRLKGALDGVLGGAAVDLLGIGLKGIRAGRAAAAVGGDAARAAVDAAPDASVLKALSRASSEREGARAVADDAAAASAGTPLVKTRRESPTAALTRLQSRLTTTPEQAKAGQSAVLTRLGQLPGVNPNPRDLTAEQRSLLGVLEHGLNAANLGSEDAQQVVRAIEDVFGDITVTHGTQPEAAQVARAIGLLADFTDVEPALVGASLARGAADNAQALVKANQLALGFNFVLQTSADRVGQLALTTNLDDPNAVAAFSRSLGVHVSLQKSVTDAASAQGRGLRARQITVNQGLGPVFKALQGAETHEAQRSLLLKIRAAYGEGGVSAAAAVARIASATVGQRTFAITSELYIESILSGAKTLTIQPLSNAILSVYLPAERALGGLLTRNTPLIRESLAQIVGLTHGVRDSLQAAKRVLREGQILDPGVGPRDDPFSGGAVKAVATARAAGEPGFFQHAARFIAKASDFKPSSIIGAGDEFFKQLTARSSARATLLREAAESGLDSAGAAAHVQDGLDRLFYKGQLYSAQQLQRRALDEAARLGITDPLQLNEHVARFVKDNASGRLSAIAEKALDRGRETTLSTPLRPGTLTHGYQVFASEHPILRFFTPFIRTPANINFFVGQRLDLPGLLNWASRMNFDSALPQLESSRIRLVRDLGSQDLDRRSESIGRLVAGVGLAGTGVILAANGTITGRGPKDPEQRRVLTDAGWLPYSIKSGDKYVQYLRLDPVASFLGLAADMAEYGRMAHTDDQGLVERTMFGLATALANGMTQKTFLLGIQDLTDVLSDPSRNVEDFVSRYAGAVVPNTLAQAVFAFGDDHMREAHGVLERLRSRIPGLSDDLAPQRNLLGEPVSRAYSLGSGRGAISRWVDLFSPIAMREVTNEPLRREFARLQHGFQPPPTSRAGLDLHAFALPSGQTAYDRWAELHGTATVGGRTLEQDLLRLIRSRDYGRLTDVSSDTLTSPRVNAIGRVVGRHREAAFAQLLKELPGLATEYRSRVRELRLVRAGRATVEDQGSTPTGVSFLPR